MKKVIVILAALVIAGGCVMHTGGGQRDLDRFASGRGRDFNFAFGEQRHVGELIGFRADTAFLLASRALYAIPKKALYVQNNDVSTFPTGSKMRPSERAARYPMGITVELEQQLLARLDQPTTRR